MYRDHTCGELRISDAGKKVTLAGWVQRSRKLGGMTFIDLRDRYGITQLVVEADAPAELVEAANGLGREFVIQAVGTVVERASKNPKMPTGDIEIKLDTINVLNASLTPPFTIEDNSDGGEDLRAKYRYLDLRRNPLQKALQLRHRICHETREYLDAHGFLEIETPFLINSTPEGARDFVVPSRMNPGTFYALPQSPQTLKQSLPIREAMARAVNQSFATVLTSGSIMTIAGLLIGLRVSDVYVSHIGLAVGRGAFCSVVLVLTVLPQLLVLLDGAVEKTRFRVTLREEGEQ